MAAFIDLYIGDITSPEDPRVSPIMASPATLASCPPAVIITAGHDPLRDEGEEYGHALLANGVEASIYTGNGSTDGPFVYTGFRPAFVIIKNTTNAQDWMMFDSARNTYNATNLYLQPNQASAEASGIGDATDFLSNGFKIKSTNGTVNTSTQVYIFMCFASNPFKYALAR
jgi:acetyl esterase/lipase